MRADLHGRVRRTLPAGLPGEGGHPPRLRGDDALVGRVPGIGTASTPTAHRAVDEAGIVERQRRVVRTEIRRLPGAERGDDDVGAGREPVEALAAPGGPEVEFDAALAAQPHRRGGESAERIAARPLDLDHLRAKVGEHHRREAARRPVAEIDHSEIGEQIRHR